MTDTSNEVIEVELAFLIDQIPDSIKDVTPVEYTDIYLSPKDDLLVKLRLRQKGDRYELTKKVVTDPSDLSIQEEYNIPLTSDEFALFKTLGGRTVNKNRYNITLAGRTAEVDIFQGDLEGLVLLEFEFESEAERDAFTPPSICKAEVTQEDFIAGAYLAGKTYADIDSDLERYNYRPLTLK